MKNSCIKIIETDKGEMTVNLCKMIGQCKNKDCKCEYSRRLKEQNEEIGWDDAGHNAMMNSMSTSKNVKWIIKDEKTGKINMENNYNVKVGGVKKIRFVNSKSSMHLMQHPMHLHGQRFLVLSIDGKQNENLVWKDTVLVSAGKTVDILVEFSNLWEWVMHCHIAEHLEAGMMTHFTVS